MNFGKSLIWKCLTNRIEMGCFMKYMSLFLILILALTVDSYSQITNLTVLGGTTSFTAASGDLFGWSYDVPKPGDTTLIQIWIDTDQNGLLNTSTDVLWTYFNQIDGDTRGHNGPPDIDGLANGHVSFQQKLGLAPAHYIMVFKNHNNYKTFTGTINNLASPAFTISGNVTVPAGSSKKNIMMSLENQGENGNGTFWNALTDSSGHFAIQMNSDTSGNPWSLRTDNNLIFGSAVVSPQEYSLTITPATPTYSGNNFTVTASAASITGTVKDENGNPFVGAEVQINSNSGSFFRYAQIDTSGSYKIGLLSTELPQTNLSLSSGRSEDTTIVSGFYRIPSIAAGNTITHNLTIYKTNSIISGKVTLNGKSPGFGMQLFCMNSDTGFVNAFTDPNGNFRINVSNKIYNYNIGSIGPLPQGYNNNVTVLAHPGQTNVVLNIALTDVKQEGSGIPSEYNLSQNYPNPFNPVTTINFSLPKEGHVKLTVYNAIGSIVTTLVDENKPAGYYSVRFNGSGLASGIYFYRLESGNFTADRKLILLK